MSINQIPLPGTHHFLEEVKLPFSQNDLGPMYGLTACNFIAHKTLSKLLDLTSFLMLGSKNYKFYLRTLIALYEECVKEGIQDHREYCRLGGIFSFAAFTEAVAAKEYNSDLIPITFAGKIYAYLDNIESFFIDIEADKKERIRRMNNCMPQDKWRYDSLYSPLYEDSMLLAQEKLHNHFKIKENKVFIAYQADQLNFLVKNKVVTTKDQLNTLKQWLALPFSAEREILNYKNYGFTFSAAGHTVCVIRSGNNFILFNSKPPSMLSWGGRIILCFATPEEPTLGARKLIHYLSNIYLPHLKNILDERARVELHFYVKKEV